MIKTVLVIRNDDEFSRTLRSNQIPVINLELVRTEPLNDQDPLRSELTKLSRYDGLIFTSAAAASVFVANAGTASGEYAGKIYALGQRSQAIFAAGGWSQTVLSSAGTAAAMIDQMPESEIADKNLLFVRGDHTTGAISAYLSEKARVTEVIVYRTVECPIHTDIMSSVRTQLDERQIGWICFFSPSGIEAFVRAFGVPLDVKIAAIGPTTAKRAAECGFAADLVSSQPDASHFAEELISQIL